MSNYGPYTGDKRKAGSYLYGPHWKNSGGFQVLKGRGNYNHCFGGDDWDVPVCKNCGTKYHQIFTFDLEDPKLEEIRGICKEELALVSCLNCSASWEPQIFKIDFKDKKIEVRKENDKQHWKQPEELQMKVPLPRIHVYLENLREEDNPIDRESYYRITDEYGDKYICRVLGAPVYMQNPIDRECPECHGELKYIAMVGSEGINSEGIMEGSVFDLGEMTLYFSYCRECNIIKAESQGT